MTFHDPFEVVNLLRNHLATHDNPILFLFGAGTSASVNTAPPTKPGEKPQHWPLIPPTGPLTDICAAAVSELGKDYGAAWASLVMEGKEMPGGPQVENLLSRIRAKLVAAGPTEKPLGLTKVDLETLEKTVCQAIATAASPSEAQIPKTLPHDDFAHWVKRAARVFPLELFTTNYDVLFERSLERTRVPVFDGFVGSFKPYFSAETIENERQQPPVEWVRLWKLHGSVNWDVDRQHSGRRIIKTDSEKPTGQMILPSHLKYDEARKQPYQALMDRLSVCLRGRNSLLVTCGYSFRDQHIDSVIYDALSSYPLTHVVALVHGDVDQSSQLVGVARHCPNLMVVGRNDGVVRRAYGQWRLSKAVDKTTHAFMDDAFDSKAEIEEKRATEGHLTLGDFVKFARFLRSMEMRREANA